MSSHSRRSRISSLKVAAAAASAVTALTVSQTALAASTGGTGTPQAAHAASNSLFTIGLNSTRVKPGAKLSISGLAYARAGLNLTIVSDAIASGRFVSGMPAVETPALVEGEYHTIVRIPPATKPGVYSVSLRFGDRQVAALHDLRVLGSASHEGGHAHLNACAGIGFTVLHNDRAGIAYLPAGGYTVSSRNLACWAASSDLTRFLAAAGRPVPGWTTSSPGAGRATFTQVDSGLGFSVVRRGR